MSELATIEPRPLIRADKEEVAVMFGAHSKEECVVGVESAPLLGIWRWFLGTAPSFAPQIIYTLAEEGVKHLVESRPYKGLFAEEVEVLCNGLTIPGRFLSTRLVIMVQGRMVNRMIETPLAGLLAIAANNKKSTAEAFVTAAAIGAAHLPVEEYGADLQDHRIIRAARELRVN